MKLHSAYLAVPSPITDDRVREFAFQLYEQSGRTPGRDLENWLEAAALLTERVVARESNRRRHDLASRWEETFFRLTPPVGPTSKSGKQSLTRV
jgi:hypothetical protein